MSLESHSLERQLFTMGGARLGDSRKPALESGVNSNWPGRSAYVFAPWEAPVSSSVKSSHFHKSDILKHVAGKKSEHFLLL